MSQYRQLKGYLFIHHICQFSWQNAKQFVCTVHWQQNSISSLKYSTDDVCAFFQLWFYLDSLAYMSGDCISLVVLVDKEWNGDLTEFRIFPTPSPALALRPQYAPTNLELGSRPQNRRLDHNTTKNIAMMPLMVMMIVTNVLSSLSNPSPISMPQKKSRPELHPSWRV